MESLESLESLGNGTYPYLYFKILNNDDKRIRKDFVCACIITFCISLMHNGHVLNIILESCAPKYMSILNEAIYLKKKSVSPFF